MLMDQATPDAEPLRLAELAAGAFVPIAEALPAMLWIGDENGKCVYLNKAQREFWGLTPADVPGFTWSSSLLPEDAAGLFAVFSKAMAEKKPFVVEARYRRADGAIRRLKTTAEPRFAPNGEFMGMVGLNTEVDGE